MTNHATSHKTDAGHVSGLLRGELGMPGGIARKSDSGSGSSGGAGDLPGLSMYHISPRTPEADAQKATVEVWRGASLVRAELGKVSTKPGRTKREWQRGEISLFSPGSRRRILRTVARLRSENMSAFATLTYPDKFEQNPRAVKKHLDSFLKRIIRKFPEILVIWRLEPKERKSGENVGKVAPHFHCLIWGADYKELKAWIGQNWYEVVKSGDERHLRAGTNVERVHSTNGVMYYTAKYICKALNYSLPGWGRYWGIANRKLIKTIQGERVVLEVDDITAKTILRYMRRKAAEVYRNKKFVGLRKFPKWGNKFTLIGRADFWEQVIIKTSKQNDQGKE